ncbi:Kinesin-like protein 6 [Ceratocystis fimbriata CBS 114723]|uniref:Kinesin-like protein 6 n=1 Tax=Ceratocystis fimbriata CBS 114723 TaxID=1035309 RepID=A0A2C5WVC7_9PEZI|nr:Kinesin-like protein 6 [Ceratocystis fimbriata CBS 114723]
MSSIDDSSASSITVSVRIRPFTIREAAQMTRTEESTLFLGDGSLAGVATPKLQTRGLRSVIKVIDDRCLVFDPPEDSPVQKFSRTVVPTGKKTKDQVFAFDRIFDENATQTDVYEATTKRLIDSVMDGYNATVFAYGATGCGKTHTITGTPQEPGIIFLTMQELFEKIDENSQDKVTEISLSYLEIYNETIRDLLVPGGSKQGLMLREDTNQAVTVAGLTSYHPKNVQEVMDMIVRGNEYRTVSPTLANAVSSRSHAVLQINVAQKDRNAAVSEPHTMATLSIIDLAGSERASATQNRGDRLIEGANINKSLLALGSCINALCDMRKHNHVPYRNSKLTRLLKFSLGGNCKTVMIVCVSPSSAHYDETQNTLRYANRAKNIQTKVTRNVFNVNRHVKDFLVKIDEQIALINELKAQQKDAEKNFLIKYRKQAEKRDAACMEGIQRIRAAYDNSASERQEKINSMRRLKASERRIALLGAWIDAFESAAAAHLNNDIDDRPSIPESLAAVRKTAENIMIELENNRHILHQKMEKTHWERAVETALSHSIKQLPDKSVDGSEINRLRQEVEMLKMEFQAQMYREILEQDKAGDSALMQVLLAAQLEMLMALNDTMGMSEEDAVAKAKLIINRLLEAGHKAVSHIVKPDGTLGGFDVSGIGSHAHPHFGLAKRGAASGGGGTPRRRKYARDSLGFAGSSSLGSSYTSRGPTSRLGFARASIGDHSTATATAAFSASTNSQGPSYATNSRQASSQVQVNGVSNGQGNAAAASSSLVSSASTLQNNTPSHYATNPGAAASGQLLSAPDADSEVAGANYNQESLAPAPFSSAVTSPLRNSPRRRKAGLGARVSASFTPVKRLSLMRPPSNLKRSVRWRDDDEQGTGTLADFANTPPRFSMSPHNQQPQEKQGLYHGPMSPSSRLAHSSSAATTASASSSSIDTDLEKPMPTPPALPSYLRQTDDNLEEGNSSIMSCDVSTASISRPNNRFAAGFLSKAPRASSSSIPSPNVSGIPISFSASSTSSPDALRSLANSSGSGTGSPSSIPRVSSPRTYTGGSSSSSSRFGLDENKSPVPSSSVSTSSSSFGVSSNGGGLLQPVSHPSASTSNSLSSSSSMYSSTSLSLPYSHTTGGSGSGSDNEGSLSPRKIRSAIQAKAKQASSRRISLGFGGSLGVSSGPIMPGGRRVSSVPGLSSISENGRGTPGSRRQSSQGTTAAGLNGVSSRRRSSTGPRPLPMICSPPPSKSRDRAFTSGQARRMNIGSSPGKNTRGGSGNSGTNRRVTISGLAGQPLGQPIPAPASGQSSHPGTGIGSGAAKARRDGSRMSFSGWR